MDKNEKTAKVLGIVSFVSLLFYNSFCSNFRTMVFFWLRCFFCYSFSAWRSITQKAEKSQLFCIDRLYHFNCYYCVVYFAMDADFSPLCFLR